MTKYNSIEEKKEAIKKQKREYARRQKAKGAGVFDFVSSLITGRKTLSPKVKKILEKYGNETIISANVGRTPVQALITGIIKMVSSTPYDKLFHLFIELKLNSGTKLILEKNAVINMDVNKTISKAEWMPVNNIPNSLTVNELLNNTQKAMGDKFLPYESKTNNCQYFIMAVLNSNNMNSEELTKFVKQDTEEIFKSPAFKKFSDVITDIGGRADVILQGGDIQTDNGILLKHLISHITDKKEPVDPRDFNHAIMIINDLKKMKGGAINNDCYCDSDSDDEDKNYIVQSLVFDNKHYTVKQAKKWLKENHYKYNDVDKKENTLRFRQIDPEEVKKKGFLNYRNKILSNNIIMVIAYKKKMGGGSIESLFRDAGKYLQPVADAAQDRAIRELQGRGFDFEGLLRDTGKYLQPVADAAQDRAIRELQGRGFNFEGLLRDTGKYLQPVADAAQDRAIREIKGGNVESLFRDVGKYLQPVADAAQDRAMKEIKGSGSKGSGRKKNTSVSVKAGRPAKGSAEAKAWGAKMAAARAARR